MQCCSLVEWSRETIRINPLDPVDVRSPKSYPKNTCTKFTRRQLIHLWPLPCVNGCHWPLPLLCWSTEFIIQLNGKGKFHQRPNSTYKFARCPFFLFLLSDFSSLIIQVNFSKKRRNRMLDDSAAAIAINRTSIGNNNLSSNICSFNTSGNLNDTDTLCLVENESVVVYKERTDL